MGDKNGQLSLLVAGTVYNFPSNTINDTVYITAFPNNLGVVYVGQGAVTSGNGYPLMAGDTVPLTNIGDIANVSFVTTSGGDKVAYLDLGW